MCDLTNNQSLASVMDWIDEITDRSNLENVVVFVLANKCDVLERID